MPSDHSGDKLTVLAFGSVEYPDDAEVIDCHGQTIIPGLISDHSHIGLVDGISIKAENYNRANILRQLASSMRLTELPPSWRLV